MKDLIIEVLNKVEKKVNKQIPSTKKDIKSIDITDVNPWDLVDFMKDNNVPSDAYFDGYENGYDAWSAGYIKLSWEIYIPTNNKEKLKFKKNLFNNIAFKHVYDILTKNGYKRVGFNATLLRYFNDTTVYDMYMNKDFDRLVKYYSLPFVKEI